MTPETQLIAISREDGSVAIMQFVTKGMLNAAEVFERPATDAAIEAEIVKAGIDATSWRRVDPADIPSDRTFRDAWADSGNIGVDMAKAREIHKDRLRKIREPKLAALDVEYQRADEQGDEAAKVAVVAKKQALRDVTNEPAIAAATSPAQLAAAVPDVLADSNPH